ncbi:MAG: phosphoenolpyruvate carboxylase [Candidatus ainarchaeum sp.]|nr:phosphoenolpyruvate carboxylase [Candidatus ainarchaeum sp.]
MQTPRCMSTQHPDNIAVPFFSDSEVLSGEAEVREAYFAFSQLGCTEQMWDGEGKEADNQVVEKLLSKYPDFFAKNQLGKELRLTYRVPNPSVEKGQGKILFETLHGIPRAFDAARTAGLETAPIFEVILPMTTSHAEMERVKDYYEKVVVGQRDVLLGEMGEGGVWVKEWAGDFAPERINVIPLFEDFDSICRSGSIVERYLEGKDNEYQRVFIARSDPALNYGAASAVLLAKVALQRLHAIEEKTGVQILPIIGVGGAPFRGNFRPDNVGNCTDEYPSVQTFTVQSSFKYDHAFRDVVNAVDLVNHLGRRGPLEIDENRAIALAEKIRVEYQKQVESVADLVNGIAAFVPNRRARKLHVGLFGYSRSVGKLKLPRAIKFCAAFYSFGVPPELLGLSALSGKEWDELHGLYVKIDEDLKDAAKYLNKENLEKMPKILRDGVASVLGRIEFEIDDDYAGISSSIYTNYSAGKNGQLVEDVKAAAWKRGFLG